MSEVSLKGRRILGQWLGLWSLESSYPQEKSSLHYFGIPEIDFICIFDWYIYTIIEKIWEVWKVRELYIIKITKEVTGKKDGMDMPNMTGFLF